jgi:hypothetical protein
MTTTRSRLAHAALAGLLLAGGCAQLRAANATPPAAMDGQLTATLQQAEAETTLSRYGVADRLLAAFAETHANTPEAVETQYWRALFKLDPANQTATPRDAIVLLDGYLGASVTIAHRGSASGLRRAAVALDRTQPVVAASPAPQATPAAGSAAPADKSRDEEVQRLRDELAKATAELERIRRRLSQPNP